MVSKVFISMCFKTVKLEFTRTHWKSLISEVRDFRREFASLDMVVAGVV